MLLIDWMAIVWCSSENWHFRNFSLNDGKSIKDENCCKHDVIVLKFTALLNISSFLQFSKETWLKFCPLYKPTCLLMINISPDMIFVIFLHSTFSKKITPKKHANRNILNLKFYIFGVFVHLIGIIFQFAYEYAHSILYQWLNITKTWITLLQLDLKHIHKVNFYPSDNNFSQTLFVTNMISEQQPPTSPIGSVDNWCYRGAQRNISLLRPNMQHEILKC